MAPKKRLKRMLKNKKLQIAINKTSDTLQELYDSIIIILAPIAPLFTDKFEHI